VLKIEPPGGEHWVRRNRPEVPGLDAMFFLVFNANKRQRDHRPQAPRGRALFLRMVDAPDVVVEKLRAGPDGAAGPRLRALRATTRAYRRDAFQGSSASPGRTPEYKSFDMIAHGHGRVMSVTGVADREPIRCGAAIGDTGTGVHTAAPSWRVHPAQRTGQGQLVEVAMQEGGANLLRGRFVGHTYLRRPAQ